jgi:chromate transporter
MPEPADPMSSSKLTSPRRPASLSRILRVWLLIGAQSFGGGVATLALIQRAAVEQEQWVEPDEFARMWALVQVAPGINLLALAILIGRRAGGNAGIAASLFGLMAPSVSITILFTAAYQRFEGLPVVRAAMRGVMPAVLALGVVVMAKIAKPMADEGRRYGRSQIVVGILLFAGSALALLRTGLPVVGILFAAALSGSAARVWAVRGKSEEAA